MRGPVDPDHLPEGTLVDCWRVVRPLGGGAYGSVYLVEKEGELYALKLARFPGNSGDKRRTDERAQRELNCLLSLLHPHIVQVRFHGRWPHPKTGFFYVVMDYVEGYTLAEWMERTHPTPHEVVALFTKVFSAVAYAHAQGIFHRDLKPTNLLVEARTKEPVVVDFGAASFPLPQPQLTDTRLPPGTPRYTSPEAQRFASVHRLNPAAHYEYKAADELYALGVTLFDLLTDPLHHSQPKPQPLVGALEVPQAQEVNARVPPALSRFVTQLLQHEPSQRPVSVEAARRALAELLPLQGEAWTKWPVHAPSLSVAQEPAPAVAEPAERGPLPAEARQEPGASAGAVQQGPREEHREEPVAQGEPMPWEARAEKPEQPVPGPGEPQEQVPVAPVNEETPPAGTPPAAAPVLSPPRRGLRYRAGVLGAVGLGLLVAWGAYLRLGATASQGPEPSPHANEEAALRPSASLAEEPSSTPPSAASPQPLVAPPSSTPEKGTAVNLRPSSKGVVPSLCAQKQPPPRGTPLWLKWCQCATVVGSMAATQAGCPAVQVRQSPTEECSKESWVAMALLEVEYDTPWGISIELDVRQRVPDGLRRPCQSDPRTGRTPLACILDGPLTSRVLDGNGKLVPGTLLSGQAWIHPPSLSSGPLFRWTEATLPDGSKHPVCIEGSGKGDECSNGASENCAAGRGDPVKRWETPLKP